MLYAATEMDKKENKTEKKAKEKKVDKKYCNAYQQEKKDSSTKATRKKCKTSEIGRRPKWCFIQIDLKMHKCTNAHLTIYTNVREFLRKQEIAPLI